MTWPPADRHIAKHRRFAKKRTREFWSAGGFPFFSVIVLCFYHSTADKREIYAHHINNIHCKIKRGLVSTSTYEVDKEAAIAISPSWSPEERLSIRRWNRKKCGGYSTGIGIRVAKVVNRRKVTSWQACLRSQKQEDGCNCSHQCSWNSSHCSLSVQKLHSKLSSILLPTGTMR